jgi:hypothetical protein
MESYYFKLFCGNMAASFQETKLGAPKSHVNECKKCNKGRLTLKKALNT